jgi:hypothetical protein
MYRSETVCVSVRCDAAALYEAFWRPERFAAWASGLSQAGLRRSGERWQADGPDGPITLRFSEHNAFGVMDHWVDLGNGRVIHVPLRIVANGAGSEVMLTLFQYPEMTEEVFQRDIAWVRRDLHTLKSVAEQEG